MARPKKNGRQTRNYPGLNLRKLRKELKLIPFDIQREMRFIDLLFSERNSVRTQTERNVLKDMIDGATKTVEFYQNRLERYQECYRQFKDRNTFDNNLLLPEELQSLRNSPAKDTEAPAAKQLRRTGTHG